MIVALLSVAGIVFVFLIGVLVGTGLVTRAQDRRDRRQAEAQRQINAARQELERWP